MEKHEYILKLWEAEATDLDLAAAEERFRAAMGAALGAPILVLAMYEAYRRIISRYGVDPDPEDLSEAEQLIVTEWQQAEVAAVAAAFGPNRYMGDAMYEISEPVKTQE